MSRLPLRLVSGFLSSRLTMHPLVAATIAPMAEPASALAAGSAGTVETQYLHLPGPVRLGCGQGLQPVRVPYQTYGTFSPRPDHASRGWRARRGAAQAARGAERP